MIFCHPPLPPPPPFFSCSSSISASSSRTSLNFGLSGAGCTLRTVVAFVNDICYCPFFFHICKTIIQDSRFISIIITQPGLNHGADKRLSAYVPRSSSEESSQIAFLFGKESNFNNSSVRAGKDKYDERWMRLPHAPIHALHELLLLQRTGDELFPSSSNRPLHNMLQTGKCFTDVARFCWQLLSFSF